MYLVKIEKIVKNGQNSFFKGFFGLKNFFNIYEIFLLILLFYVYELRFKDYINRCLNYKIVDFGGGFRKNGRETMKDLSNIIKMPRHGMPGQG
jgi:hypothetical protein